jgi:hypothetical protein
MAASLNAIRSSIVGYGLRGAFIGVAVTFSIVDSVVALSFAVTAAFVDFLNLSPLAAL